jgi:hypothetical protein
MISDIWWHARGALTGALREIALEAPRVARCIRATVDGNDAVGAA